MMSPTLQQLLKISPPYKSLALVIDLGRLKNLTVNIDVIPALGRII
jgi:hypothetical protein